MEAYLDCALPAQPEFEPDLVAFVKCHLTSFRRWDVLRMLAERVGRWAEPSELAEQIRQPADEVWATLEELSSEGILEAAGSPGRPTYRLLEREPTGTVVAWLMVQASRSQDLRQLVVAQILRSPVTGARS